MSSFITPYAPRRQDIFGAMMPDIDRVFNEIFGAPFFSGLEKRSSYPRVDAIREEGAIKFQYTVPGVKPENLEVKVHEDGVLEVSGQLSDEYISEDGQYQIRELSRLTFRRLIRLPDDVKGEPVAKLKDGILTLRFEVEEPEVVERSVKTIEVQSE